MHETHFKSSRKKNVRKKKEKEKKEEEISFVLQKTKNVGGGRGTLCLLGYINIWTLLTCIHGNTSHFLY